MNYWNPYTETLPREKLEAIEFSYFQNMFSYAKNNSNLYRDKLQGIEIGDIKTREDIKKVPFHLQRRAEEVAGERRALSLRRPPRRAD